jgi:hypothetical protein
MLPETNPSRIGRRWLKRFIYSQFSLLEFFTILLGKTQPRVPFTVKAEPPSVYFNFAIRPDQREAFARYLNLPEGFSICPIRCLADEQGDYLLTLNVYEVTGIARGIRAEWSTYVTDSAGTPRYMVLEARSSEYSMDPVDIITRKSRVEHALTDNTIVTTVSSLNEQLFSAKIALGEARPAVKLHPEWTAANDYIYWRNGVCDRTFYNAGLADPAARLLSTPQSQIDNQTHWAPFLETTPRHIVMFENAIDFVVVPWANL